MALQAMDSVSKEEEEKEKEENKEKAKEDFKEKSAQSSFKRSQLSLPSVNHFSIFISESSLTLGQASLLVIRKQAVKQATKEAKTSKKCQRGH